MTVVESIKVEMVDGAVLAASVLPVGLSPFNGVLLLVAAVLAVRAFVQPRPFALSEGRTEKQGRAVRGAKGLLGLRGKRKVRNLRQSVEVLTDVPAVSAKKPAETPPAPARATGQSSQRMLQGAFTALLDEVFVFDPDSYAVSFMNGKAEKRVDAMGLKKAKVRFPDLLPVANRQVIVEATRNLQRSGLDSIVFELSMTDNPMELTLKLIREDGADAYLMAILRDMTSRMDAARAQANYVATLSHEMRTPLTSIKGAVDLVASGRMGELSNGATSTLSVAQRNVDRLLRLTNDILDLEKMEAGKMRCDFEPLHLGGLVQEASQEIMGYARQFEVSVQPQVLAPDAMVLADRVRLLQVMANLLSNAIKYSDPRGEVHIRIEERGNDVRVSVVDQGQGVPDNLKEGLFQPYHQGPQVQRKVATTGLGLSIAKKIVEAHSGSIGFESEPGQGSTFYFDIPKLDGTDEVAA